MEKLIYWILTVFLFYFVTSLNADGIETNDDDGIISIVLLRNIQSRRNHDSEQKAEEWLSTPMEELRDKCENKNNTLYTSTALIRPYLITLFKMFSDKNPTNYINSKDCSHLPNDLTVELEAIIDAMQNCFDDSERLNQIEKKKAMEIVLKGICLRMKQYFLYETQDRECRKIVEHKADECSYSPIDSLSSYKKQSIFYMLLMITVPLTENCSEINEQINCYEEAMENCSESFKEIFRNLISPPEGTLCYSQTKRNNH